MDRLVGGWIPVWRLHRWVFALWFVGLVGVVVEIVSLVAAGFDSFVFIVAMPCVLVSQIVHQWLVTRYERRDPRLGAAVASA